MIVSGSAAAFRMLSAGDLGWFVRMPLRAVIVGREDKP